MIIYLDTGEFFLADEDGEPDGNPIGVLYGQLDDSDHALGRAMAVAAEMKDAMSRLISAWDARRTVAEQIVTAQSDADHQAQAMAAMNDMRDLLAQIGGIDALLPARVLVS